MDRKLNSISDNKPGITVSNSLVMMIDGYLTFVTLWFSGYFLCITVIFSTQFFANIELVTVSS